MDVAVGCEIPHLFVELYDCFHQTRAFNVAIWANLTDYVCGELTVGCTWHCRQRFNELLHGNGWQILGFELLR
jgi:hypothetical protein